MLLPSDADIVPVNSLLASLLREDSSAVASVMRMERLFSGQSLGTRTQPASEIWFPHSGVISLTVRNQEGRSVQSGMIGREGCVGLEGLFHGAPALAEAVVQIAGDASVVQVVRLRSALDIWPLVEAALLRFLHELSQQSLETVACDRLHSLEARCCRWLLMMWDRTSDDDLPLTQERLATMLGSGRPRINMLLASLESQGFLRRYRGRIRLLRRPALELRACECYRPPHNRK